VLTRVRRHAVDQPDEEGAQEGERALTISGGQLPGGDAGGHHGLEQRPCLGRLGEEDPSQIVVALDVDAGRAEEARQRAVLQVQTASFREDGGQLALERVTTRQRGAQVPPDVIPDLRVDSHVQIVLGVEVVVERAGRDPRPGRHELVRRDPVAELGERLTSHLEDAAPGVDRAGRRRSSESPRRRVHPAEASGR